MACTRCGGTGTILKYLHVENGICFQCQGTGVDSKNTAFWEKREVYREKNVGGTKVILATQKDLHGRFIGYSVYVEGRLTGDTFQKYKDAMKAFDELVKKEKIAKFIKRNL